ncbi:MAG: HAD-IC family P-type ATPase, partial [Acidimicrobiia bacterium]
MTTATSERAERGRSELPERPWSRPAEEVCEELGAASDAGLDADEAGRRRESFGPNRLRRHQTRSAWDVLVDQFKSVIVGLLAAASALALAFGEPVEAAAIGVVIVINAAIGFVTEYRAVRSMDALRRLGSVEAVVRRAGEIRRIPAEDVVPGDLLVLEGGDVVTADARLVEATNLEVDEASLTGESVPVAKSTEPASEEAPLAERSSMLHKGTAITSGSGEAVVTGTGMATELGHVSELVESAEDDDTTPLQRRLQALGHRLLWLTLGVGVVVAVAGILAGRDVPIIIETAVALAVAAIPEGLPIVATVA